MSTQLLLATTRVLLIESNRFLTRPPLENTRYGYSPNLPTTVGKLPPAGVLHS